MLLALSKALQLKHSLGRSPYRTGFVFPNEYIDKKNMAIVPEFVSFEKQIRKELMEEQHIASHLDFPFLTHIPRR